MKISRTGAISREQQRVLASVGNFTIEDAQAQMSCDIGGLIQRTYSFPSPAILKALEAEGLRSAPTRRLYLKDLMRMDHVDKTMLRLNEEWDKMTMDGGSVIRVIPTNRMELIYDTQPRLDISWDLDGSTHVGPAYTFFSSGRIMAPTAVNEIYSVARQLIARFTAYDGKDINTKDLFGQPTVIPAPEARVVEDITTIMSSLMGKLRADLRGEGLKERVFDPTADILFAAQRVQYYRRLYEKTNIDKIAEAAHRLMYMKLFTEALSDMSAVMERKYAFQGGTLRSIRTFERLLQNFTAVKMVDEWLGQFFSVLPHVSYMRTAGAQQRWVLSGTPDYQRIMYAGTNKVSKGTPKVEIPAIDLGGYDADLYLPVGLGNRANPGDYRTSRDPTQAVLGLDLPVIPADEDMYSPRGAMHDVFEEIAHVTVDYLSPRDYSTGGILSRRDEYPKSPVRRLSVELDGKSFRFILFPINASVTKLGGVLQGYGVERGYSVQLTHLDSTGITASSNVAFSAESDLADHLSYRPAAEVTGIVMPWEIR